MGVGSGDGKRRCADDGCGDPKCPPKHSGVHRFVLDLDAQIVCRGAPSSDVLMVLLMWMGWRVVVMMCMVWMTVVMVAAAAAVVVVVVVVDEARGLHRGVLARIRARERIHAFSPTGDTVARELCLLTGNFPAALEMHRRGLGHRQRSIVERAIIGSVERHRACVASDLRRLARVIGFARHIHVRCPRRIEHCVIERVMSVGSHRDGIRCACARSGLEVRVGA